MYAIEFDTVSKNGMIEIPPSYSEFLSKPLRVVLMMEDDKSVSKIAKIQAYVTEGIDSGFGQHSMNELKEQALSLIHSKQ